MAWTDSEVAPVDKEDWLYITPRVCHPDIFQIVSDMSTRLNNEFLNLLRAIGPLLRLRDLLGDAESW